MRVIVASTCSAWIVKSAKNGSLWTTQTPTDFGPYSDDVQVCRLRGHNDWEYATVLDASSTAGTAGQASCEDLLSTGQWVDMPAENSANYVPPKPPVSPPVARGTSDRQMDGSRAEFDWVQRGRREYCREPAVDGLGQDAGTQVVTSRMVRHA
jgi:hypothetical protein